MAPLHQISVKSLKDIEQITEPHKMGDQSGRSLVSDKVFASMQSTTEDDWSPTKLCTLMPLIAKKFLERFKMQYGSIRAKTTNGKGAETLTQRTFANIQFFKLKFGIFLLPR